MPPPVAGPCQRPSRMLRLHRPGLDSVAACLRAACAGAFAESEVAVLPAGECPDDLAGDAFRLAGVGFGGGGGAPGPVMVHVGGVPYLLPTPQPLDRRYDLRQLLAEAGHPDGLILGAGAASSALFGKNAEFVANLGPLGNCCRVASVADDSSSARGLDNCRLSRVEWAEVGLLGDFVATAGRREGHVIRLKLRHWLAEAREGGGAKIGHVTDLLQHALAREFASCPLPVGLGGVFRLDGSPARMHVMPDFSACPLASLDDVNSWLHFVDMPGPLVCCGALLSHDPRSWSLRLEHFHGWNPDAEAFGGHYHNDVDHRSAEYTAYFCLAESLLRVDPPSGVEGLSDQ